MNNPLSEPPTLAVWLIRIGGMLVLASLAAAVVGWTLAPRWTTHVGAARNEVFASIGLALAAMLAGLVPLRTLLSAGAHNIVAAWTAAMLVRMLLCLIGVIVLIKLYGMSPALCALTVAGHYVLLLAIETTAMTILIRRLLV